MTAGAQRARSGWRSIAGGAARAGAAAACTGLLAGVTVTRALGPADPGPQGAIAEARLLAAALESVAGLVASFTQTVESPALPAPQVERGTVFLLRPGRVRFEYDVPRGKLALCDGRKTWLYLPEDRQVIVAPLGAPGTRGGVSLLIEERVDLLRDFDVAWGPAPSRGAAPPLKLTPRSRRAEYDHLLVETGEEHLVRQMTVVDPLGGRVTYRFARLRREPTLDARLFSFSPPAGVEVREAGP